VLTRAAGLAAALALATVPARAAPFDLSRTIANPTPAAGDFFGAAVALVGGRIVVGAHFDDTGAPDAGAAFVFDGASGLLLHTLAAPAPAAGDQLGFAVATLGGDVLVAAPHRDAGAARAGAVHLFDAASGVLRRTFTNPTPAFDDLFGFAVAGLGTDVLVGAPFDEGGAPGAGAAYLFDVAGALRHTLANPAPGDFDLFGRAVALGGATAVVGAPFDDGPADAPVANAGAAHVFDPRSGALLHTLGSPRATAGDSFGWAVAGGAGTVVVGAPFDDTVASNGGAAYLFDGATGALLRTFVSPAPTPDERFGSAVVVNGAAVVVGAPFADAGAAGDVGRAWVFDAGAGTLLATLENPSPHAGDQFGAALAAAGGAVVVGAWLDDTGSPNAGAVHSFLDASLPTTSSTTSTSTTFTTVSAPTAVTTSTTTTTSATATTTEDPGAGRTTTTTTLAAGSTTTLRGPPDPTTTSTLPRAACAVGCDDADPCTTDGCAEDGSCAHVPATGLDGVACRLDALDEALHATAPLMLGGARPTARLQKRIARAHRLVEAAGAAGGSRRKLRRAGRALRSFTGLVERGVHRGRIAQRTGDALLALSAEAAGTLASLTTR
jgi:hypothetical protein